MNKNVILPTSRVEAEIQRERKERQHNDDIKTGASGCDDFRSKDARENDSAGALHRLRGS